MALPLIAGAAAVGAKAMPFISKHLLSLLLGAGYFTSTGLGAAGKWGERGLSREQMRTESKIAGASVEAGKKATAESRARAKEYTEQLLKAKRKERKEVRNLAAMESFTRSQDRQMALILQAVQAMSQPSAAVGRSSGGGGMLGLMRGGV